MAKNFANSWGDKSSALITLIIVPHDGQRGVPSGENCLLLLNVVASSPLSFASPDLLKPCDFAKFSNVFQKIECVMMFPLVLIDVFQSVLEYYHIVQLYAR